MAARSSREPTGLVDEVSVQHVRLLPRERGSHQADRSQQSQVDSGRRTGQGAHGEVGKRFVMGSRYQRDVVPMFKPSHPTLGMDTARVADETDPHVVGSLRAKTNMVIPAPSRLAIVVTALLRNISASAVGTR